MNMSEVNAREIRPDTWKLHVDDKHTDLIRIKNMVYISGNIGGHYTFADFVYKL